MSFAKKTAAQVRVNAMNSNVALPTSQDGLNPRGSHVAPYKARTTGLVVCVGRVVVSAELKFPG